MNKLLLPVAGLAVLVPVAHGQVTKTKEGYILRAKYVKGATLRFTSTNTISGQKGQPGAGNEFSMPFKLDVLDVQAGLATVKLTLGGVKMGETEIRPGQTATMKLTNRNVGAGQNSQNVGAQLPSGAIRVGETWQAATPVSSQAGTGKLNATYTFAGLKTVDKKPVAIINYKTTGYANGTGVMAILVADGLLYTNQIELKLNMGGGSPLVVKSLTKRS